jgi:transposase
MANQFKVAVKETTEELRHRLKRALSAHNQERLQMLYWIKTRTVSTRAELAERLERNESTIYRWLKRYQQGGIEALLTVKTAPGKVSKIPPVALEQLKQRLAQPQGFNSYGQIQQWLEAECGVVVAYRTVHQTVRYKLNAKLKVPRPRSKNAKPEVQLAFKKNSKA